MKEEHSAGYVSSDFLPDSVVQEVKETFADIHKTLGILPGFTKLFSQRGLVGAWQELKAAQLGAESAIPRKYRDLISLGVASQIPCRYLAYLEHQACLTHGGAEDEIAEAIAVAAMARHWSVLVNGFCVDESRFRKNVSLAISFREEERDHGGGSVRFVEAFENSEGARQDILATFGVVPEFMSLLPDAYLPGAWSEFKSVQLNPQTVIPALYKELIALAVAALVPSRLWIHWQSANVNLHGGGTEETREAIAVAAFASHLSTIFNGFMLDETEFRTEVDRFLEFNKELI